MSEYIRSAAVILEATKPLEDRAKILIDDFFDALRKVAKSHDYTEKRRWRDENTKSQILAKCQYEKGPDPQKGINHPYYVMVVASIGGPEDPDWYGHKTCVSLSGAMPNEPLIRNLDLNKPEEDFNNFLKQYGALRELKRTN